MITWGLHRPRVRTDEPSTAKQTLVMPPQKPAKHAGRKKGARRSHLAKRREQAPHGKERPQITVSMSMRNYGRELFCPRTQRGNKTRRKEQKKQTSHQLHGELRLGGLNHLHSPSVKRRSSGGAKERGVNIPGATKVA